MSPFFKQLSRALNRQTHKLKRDRRATLWERLQRIGSAALRSLVSGASVLTVVALPIGAEPALAVERMVDRCSAHLSVPTTGFDEMPDADGAIVFQAPEASTDWSKPFTVELDRDGFFRWWCNSTIGNIWDLGTWNVEVDALETLECAAAVIVKSQTSGVKAGDFKCVGDAVKVEPGASAYKGWTPERSRCDNRSNLIRVRRGDTKNRRIEFECLGRVTSRVSLEPETSCRELMARDWEASSTQPIVNFWSPGRLDNSLMSNPSWRSCPGDFESPDYRAFRVEGLVLKSPLGTSLTTVPLYHYYNPETNDNATTRSLWVTGIDRDDQPALGYRLSAVAGHIFAPSITPTADMLALHTWYDPARRDFFTTTQANWVGRLGDLRGDYMHVRHEGYVLKAE